MPNLAAMEIYSESLDPRFSSIDLFALRDIEAGSELTLNYGYADRIQRADGSVKAIECRCGAENCSGHLWR
jgi:SET domain-containing protein